MGPRKLRALGRYGGREAGVSCHVARLVTPFYGVVKKSLLLIAPFSKMKTDLRHVIKVITFSQTFSLPYFL